MDKEKVAVITGITGQGGSHLAELLPSKGYEVRGVIRCFSIFNISPIDFIYQDPQVKNSKLCTTKLQP